jgi:hypothetical protein
VSYLVCDHVSQSCVGCFHATLHGAVASHEALLGHSSAWPDIATPTQWCDGYSWVCGRFGHIVCCVEPAGGAE